MAEYYMEVEPIYSFSDFHHRVSLESSGMQCMILFYLKGMTFIIHTMNPLGHHHAKMT